MNTSGHDQDPREVELVWEAAEAASVLAATVRPEDPEFTTIVALTENERCTVLEALADHMRHLQHMTHMPGLEQFAKMRIDAMAMAIAEVRPKFAA